jgi:hypothetical protein
MFGVQYSTRVREYDSTRVREMSAVIEKKSIPENQLQTFLSENCRQCRNDNGNFDHDNCVDTVDDTYFLYEEELYRTSDDKTCWSKDTYDKWLKDELTNPNTRAILRDIVGEQNTSDVESDGEDGGGEDGDGGARDGVYRDGGGEDGDEVYSEGEGLSERTSRTITFHFGRILR